MVDHTLGESVILKGVPPWVVDVIADAMFDRAVYALPESHRFEIRRCAEFLDAGSNDVCIEVGWISDDEMQQVPDWEPYHPETPEWIPWAEYYLVLREIA